MYCQKYNDKYTEIQKQHILDTINSDLSTLSRYDITKGRSKKIFQWINCNGPIKSISDVEIIDSFSEKHAQKLFDSIIQEKVKPVAIETNVLKNIKGRVLHPSLSDAVIQAAKSVLTVYINVNSASWTLIDKDRYEVLDWQYQGIEHPENKKFQLSDILEISWKIVNKLPKADIYVMKAESTSLRGSGSDPSNPKVLAVNLQKFQMISMIVALLSTRANDTEDSWSSDSSDKSQNKRFRPNVYFLRSSLPFRVYGTLIGNERVASDQTVETIIRDARRTTDCSHVYLSDELKSMFLSQMDLERDMMAQCFLFALTFMDLCVYKNKQKIAQLLASKNDT
ncbi:transcription elongation factor, mitochondrial isoform X2 [Leptidea sinapis]|nr:transcription elongation factor, mitochondrial isoform X2 [Leptidea sinapis]XP_050666396.1 transcription elongation factor, mitochondrial isoform X2 [Leptidea sinapis]